MSATLIMKCPICERKLEKEHPFESICCSGCGWLWIGGGCECEDF